jgi:hypothetical protein
VVHTLGTLLEDGRYKKSIRDGDLAGLVGSFFQGGANPLEKGGPGSYEVINRDAALRVCETFIDAPQAEDAEISPRPFVYISAEDVFRPLIPARYIETKREAEREIERMMLDKPGYRGVYIRPSLVYHAHHRPLTSPAAALIDLSATLHSKIPPNIPTPSGVLRALGSAFAPESPLESMANCLSIPPIHVEHVAQAICCALLQKDVRGAVGVRRMRELIGWAEQGQTSTPLHS